MGHQNKQDDSDMYLRKVFVGGVRPETSDEQFKHTLRLLVPLMTAYTLGIKRLRPLKGLAL